MSFTSEGCEKVWHEWKVSTALHRTFSHITEVWTRGIQTGVTAIFHVSQLNKFLKAPVDVVLPEVTPLEADWSYPDHLIKILDQKDRVTRHKTLKFFKIQWSNHSEEEATWESEAFLHSHHPRFALP
jgi:hypothetical protein